MESVFCNYNGDGSDCINFIYDEEIIYFLVLLSNIKIKDYLIILK